MAGWRVRAVAAFGWALLASASPAAAKDHLLTFGGGSSANNNQVSLEKNVLYLQRFLSEAGLHALPHEILFADGTGGARDLEYEDPSVKPPRANELLAEIFGMERGLTTRYRSHSIPNLWGPSNRQSLGKWFDTVGKTLADGDRLIIYYTGHGGRGGGGRNRAASQPTGNQTLAMWGEADLTVRDFDAYLEKLPPKVSVVLVMVQCFGGGFADVIFDQGDANRSLTARNRCGFFATIPTRVAAGCTADVDEENYREYSTYFWAALSGRTRTGEAVAPPDFDGDGKVSLAEAHAYTLIHSDTIDIPMKTSDALLRKFSNSKPDSVRGTLSANADYPKLMDVASPADKAVLEGLSDVLKLEGPNRCQQVLGIVTGLDARRRLLEQKKQRNVDAHNQIRASLQTRLKSRWPELGNLLNPEAVKLVATQGDEVVTYVEAAPRYKEFAEQGEQIDAADREIDQIERRWVKCQRFLRQAETVALEANLPKLATEAVQRKYDELIAAEGAQFHEGN